jgi:hypothetical protein
MGVGFSPYPYALVFPQDEHERLLIDHLTGLGVRVERRTELLHFEEASGLQRLTFAFGKIASFERNSRRIGWLDSIQGHRRKE